MLRNYVITTFRTLYGHKLFSFINIAGLALGLTACLLILLFVMDELGYDSWLPGSERIYRVGVIYNSPGRPPMRVATSPGPVEGALLKDYPSDIEATARVYWESMIITTEDKQFLEPVNFVSKDFFTLFDLEMVAGNRDAILDNPLAIILSESVARKYFGETQAVGRRFTLDQEYDYEVVAVMKDLPENTHFLIGAIALFDEGRYADNPWLLDRWFSSNLWTYVKLRPGVDAEEFFSRMPDFVDRNAVMNFPGFEDVRASEVLELPAIALEDIHLYGKAQGQYKAGGDIVAVYSFSAIAFLILIIASINFMNLSTARSMQRAREVSLRKVVGATRGQLVRQFLGESLLTALLALVGAIILTELALPWYNDFLGKSLSLDLIAEPTLLASALLLTLAVGLIGGLYPAFYLSHFRPAEVLKANQSSTNASPTLRNILVVVQFAISIGLIVSTGVVYGQTLYARNIELGFNKDHKLTLAYMGWDRIEPQVPALKAELRRLPGVTGLAMSSDRLPMQSNNNMLVVPFAGTLDDQQLIERFAVGYDFFNVYDIRAVAGRLFSEDFPGDVRFDPEEGEEGMSRANVVINESALGKLNFASPQEAIGQGLSATIGNNPDVMGLVTIVGVVPDAHFRSIHFDITPMMFMLQDEGLAFLTVAFDGATRNQTVAAIDRIWARLITELPVTRSFVDDTVNGLYKAEEERARMLLYFALFAVAVATLGLYGLASFTAERRTREIGLRKVMGATVGDIVRLLVWQFSKPVLLANLMAWPLAAYFLNDWLKNFSYRIDLEPWLFVSAGMIALFIAWATVVHHAVRVARANPAHALRTD